MSEINKKVLKLIGEMEREAYYEGRSEGLYTHHTTFHTADTRREMLNHKQIKEQILGEIAHLLEEPKP